ncbi:MAG TPA: YggS family pyridoxal phosphate enzyme, partial [Clostridia bacterium]|nr:YggS family pyridoxal phosphate enzyme [Clostridia bacterium]
MDFLSMGMTNDFEVAVEEGANMVRIGRAIFNTTQEWRKGNG